MYTCIMFDNLVLHNELIVTHNYQDDRGEVIYGFMRAIVMCSS